MNSLEAAFEWYRVTKETYRLVGRILTEDPSLFAQMAPCTFELIGEVKRKLCGAIEALDYLALVAIVSGFECIITKQAARCITGDYQEEENPGDLCGAVRQYAVKELQRHNFVGLLDAFKVRVDADLVGQAKQIYNYRSWVVHGRKGAKPFLITPGEAYARLSEFVEATITDRSGVERK